MGLDLPLDLYHFDPFLYTRTQADRENEKELKATAAVLQWNLLVWDGDAGRGGEGLV